MKKLESLSSGMFEKFETSNLKNLNTFLGGTRCSTYAKNGSGVCDHYNDATNSNPGTAYSTLTDMMSTDPGSGSN
jgi:hypothetical protein